MNRIIVIAGPTAVGKTEYAIDLANKINGEIINCDSMQLYKFMDIGSAKPTEQELKLCKHHLVDCIDPKEDFSVAEYQKLALEAIESVISHGKIPIVVGGTGLYLNSILYDMDFSNANSNSKLRQELLDYANENGNEALHKRLQYLDENAAKKIHPNNVKKVIRAIERIEEGEGVEPFDKCIASNPDYDFKLICLNRNRDELYDRINKRVDRLIEKGLVDEVSNLLHLGLKESNISMKGIGYKEIIGYLHDEYDLNTAIDLVKKNTRHFAKRQITWFKRYHDMKWINISDFSDKEEVILDILKYCNR